MKPERETLLYTKRPKRGYFVDLIINSHFLYHIFQHIIEIQHIHQVKTNNLR